MAENNFLRLNNGTKLSFSDFKDIKEEELEGADEETKRLFNIFAGDDHILQAEEAKNLWDRIKTAASSNKNGDNSLFESDEMQSFIDNDECIKKDSGETIFSLNSLTLLISKVFDSPIQEEQTTVQNTQVTKEQTVKACKEHVVGAIAENISDAEEVFNSQYLGDISGAYDDSKGTDNKLKTSNVKKVIDYQEAGTSQLIEAKNGTLTRRAYYEENKNRIKKMIMTRLTVLKTPSGTSCLDAYRGKYSKEQLTEIVSNYVEKLCHGATMDKLKEIQKNFVSYLGGVEVQGLRKLVNSAIDNFENPSTPLAENESNGLSSAIPSYWDSAEPITFEEVYKIERGTDYSQEKVEKYVLAKAEMQTVTNAYNRKQQFIDAAQSIINEKSLSVEAKLQKIMVLYSEFYAIQDDGGLGELEKSVEESNTLIKFGENGLDLSAYKGNKTMMQSALDKLLSVAIKEKENDFKLFLGDKTIEDYQKEYETSTAALLGADNAKMLSEAMKNDNVGVIQRWTGNASMAGMGMTAVGGVLCFTPLAPIGALLVTAGNTIAVGGMVAKNGLGFADYFTKDVQTNEELGDLTKGLIMDAGGFVIGIGAGKVGMKAFNKLIDKKLVEVFKTEITAGNRAVALKAVFTNAENLKNFAKAGGAKLSTDFLISFAGDLAMIGVLDTKDDWRSLLQANLTGLLVGASGDLKSVSGAGKGGAKKKVLTQKEYGDATLGKEVTIKDPATGKETNGTVTEVKTEDGVTTVKVGDEYYPTDNVVSVKIEAEEVDPQVKSETSDEIGKNETVTVDQPRDIGTRLENSSLKNIENTNVNLIDHKWAENNNIESFTNLKIAGNGAISFVYDNNYYQIQYKEGKATALYLLDKSTGEQLFFEYDSAGQKKAISEEEFMVHKNESAAEYDKIIDAVSNPPKNQRLTNGQSVYISSSNRIGLGENNVVELDDPTWQSSLEELENGQSLTIGCAVGQEFTIQKISTYIYKVTDKSKNGITINPRDLVSEAKVFEIDTALEKQPNLFELSSIFKKGNLAECKNSKNGRLAYKIGDTMYVVLYDKSGKVVGYSKNITKEYYYLYDKNGIPKKVTEEEFSNNYKRLKGKSFELKTEFVDEIMTFDSTLIDIETLLKYNSDKVSRFNSYSVHELNNLVKTKDDSLILNALLKEKNVSKDTSELTVPEDYTYNSSDILNILKSDKAKKYILDRLNKGKSFSKSDLKKLDENLFIEPNLYKLETKRDLSHTIEDISLNDKNGKPFSEEEIKQHFESNLELRQKIPEGEVANINGHLYVNEGNTITKLNMSKETFENLFPINKRHEIRQGSIGDCWLVAAMGALMDNPNGRAAIYKMFSEDGKDILVKFPNVKESIRFKNGKLNNLAPISIYYQNKKLKIGFGSAHVKASMGLRMLEQAYSIHRHDGYKDANITDKSIQDIFFMNKQMKNLESGKQTEAISNILGKYNVTIKEKTYASAKEYMELLEEGFKDPNSIITFSTDNVLGDNPKYDLVSQHAYRVVGYDKTKGTISISNPWHNNQVYEIPVTEWLNHIKNVSVIKLK